MRFHPLGSELTINMQRNKEIVTVTHTGNRINIINRERMGDLLDSEGSGPGLRPEWQEEAHEKIQIREFQAEGTDASFMSLKRDNRVTLLE